MSLEYIQYGEFKRLVEYATSKLDVIIQELKPQKFYVLAIDTGSKKAFTVKYNRTPQEQGAPKPRTWRIENIAPLLASIGVTHFQIKMLEVPDNED